MIVGALSALISATVPAGRTGDQLLLQERENKRVAEESREMREMMAKCAAMTRKSN
jgi:hypothetical protein